MANEGFRDLVNGAVRGRFVIPEGTPERRHARPALPAARRIALVYAPVALVPGYAAFLSLDDQLFRIAAHPREAALTQLRFAWWREELTSGTAEADPAHPVLAGINAAFGLPFADGAGLVDGWEEFAVGDDLLAGARAVSAGRAKALGTLAGEVDGAVSLASDCWTLVELAGIARSEKDAERLRAAARAVPHVVLPPAHRPLAVLAGLARRALAQGRDRLIGDRLSPLAAIRLGIFGR